MTTLQIEWYRIDISWFAYKLSTKKKKNKNNKQKQMKQLNLMFESLQRMYNELLIAVLT